MRDILITVLIFGALPFVFRVPKLGAYLWAWVSMMVPHRLAYGFAHSLPFAQAIAGVTLVALLFSKQRKPLRVTTITVIQILLFLWMCVTSVFALNTADVVLDRLLFVAKIQLMLLVTMMLLRGRADIERLVWIVTLSIGFYGFKGGLWTVLQGGGGRVWGPPGGFFEENNSLAVALVMIVPFLYYFHGIARRKLLRWALVAGMLTTAFAILGSQSRGALLAVTAMALFLGLKSKYPVRMTLSIVLTGALVVGFMPDTWSKRMETVQTYQDDGSAMSRIYTWQTMWNVALDRPLVGAGFRADTPEVFARYAPHESTDMFVNGGYFVAHSIYFQALGEHGFPGLGLYLLLGIVTWRTASRLARRARDDPEFADWLPPLMHMSQVSLIGFAAGGAFLSLMQADLPFYVVCFVVLAEATVLERQLARARQSPVGEAVQQLPIPSPPNRLTPR